MDTLAEKFYEIVRDEVVCSRAKLVRMFGSEDYNAALFHQSPCFTWPWAPLTLGSM